MSYARYPDSATSESLVLVAGSSALSVKSRPRTLTPMSRCCTAGFGPRQIRQESAMLRPYNMATGAAPFESLQVADCGDVPINTFHLEKSVEIITEWYTERIFSHGTIPLTIGGDHTIALPLLRAVAAKYGHGKVGLVHVDAHADVNEHMFGEQYAHGTPFRRAVEENLIGEAVCTANGGGRLIDLCV